MRLNCLLCGAALAITTLAASSAHAQVAPFFNNTPTAFTPQIGVVQSGAALDVQATVSADRKYVTLTMRPQLSTLLALRQFTFQQGANAGNLGFVGLPGRGGGAGAAGGVGAAGQARPAWEVRPLVQSNLLARPGMTRIPD
jgi:general secretion pathway protein D